MAFLTDLFDFRLFLLAALLFVPLERLLAARKSQPVLRPLWTLDLIYVFANGILIRLGLVGVAALILAASPLLVAEEVGAWVAGQPLWLQTIEVVVLADLGLYFAHRMFHAVPALWRIHQVHHSIEHMDWLAAHRVHPIDQILTKSISLLPCFALGFSAPAIAIFGLIFHFQSLLLHANIRLSFGPLDRLIVSPDFHHWHHSRDREAWDRNYAAQLSVWDFLFGSAYLPRGKKAESFGIGEQLPQRYGAQLLYPFRRRAALITPPGSATAPGIG
jgi:sterol desaturase/sphingolipid hydroxylase (fatty acid hydroxylase superfamily)